jgi:hypothetical protein
MTTVASPVAWLVLLDGKRVARAGTLGGAKRLAARLRRRHPDAVVVLLPY